MSRGAGSPQRAYGVILKRRNTGDNLGMHVLDIGRLTLIGFRVLILSAVGSEPMAS